MALDSVSKPVEDGEEVEEKVAVVWEEGKHVDGPEHHPSAPADEIWKIISILNQWTAAKGDKVEDEAMVNEYHVKDVDLDRLLDCCCRYSQWGESQK